MLAFGFDAGPDHVGLRAQCDLVHFIFRNEGPGNGAGQTIALIEMYNDPNIQASLNAFDAAYGLPKITLNVINQAGTQTNSGWAQEESLDVEWAHAIAPGANIVVVEAAPGFTETQELNNLMTAVQTANKTTGVTVVSMSWGFPEFSNEASYDSNFTTPGITYIAASGDSGNVEWPAASPNVLVRRRDHAQSEQLGELSVRERLGRLRRRRQPLRARADLSRLGPIDGLPEHARRFL